MGPCGNLARSGSVALKWWHKVKYLDGNYKRLLRGIQGTAVKPNHLPLFFTWFQKLLVLFISRRTSWHVFGKSLVLLSDRVPFKVRQATWQLMSC